MDPEIIEKQEEFREHLTLGVVKALEKIPMIRDVILAPHQPSDNIAITSWEQRYSTMLPNEIKDFFLGNILKSYAHTFRYFLRYSHYYKFFCLCFIQ